MLCCCVFLYMCPSTCVYPRHLCFFMWGTAVFERTCVVDFFFFFFFFVFLCLGVGLRSKASVCQYLVIVCASIFIFHSLWSLSPCVWPNYITWPCPVHITPTPCAPRNVEAEVTGDVPLGDQERFSRWICGVSLLSCCPLSNPSHISAFVSPFGAFAVKEMLSTHTSGLWLARMFCGCCVWYKG